MKTVQVDGIDYPITVINGVDHYLQKYVGYGELDYFIAKPVAKPVEKQTNYNLSLDEMYGTSDDWRTTWEADIELTKPQATALAAAIQAVIEYCQSDTLEKVMHPFQDHIVAIGAARKAMQQDQL